jgi:hypothetical protein
MLGQLDDLSLYKLLIGLVNIVFGTFFVVIYLRYARKSSIRKENRASLVVKNITQIFKKNLAALAVLVTECLFTVIPNLLYLITDNLILPFVDLRVATLRGVGYTTDALITAIVYYYTWNKVIRPTIIVRPQNNQQHGNITHMTNNHS